MKKVDVEVEEKKFWRYTWTCPNCKSLVYQDLFPLYSEPRQTIHCSTCGTPLYRHAPGEYGTEKVEG